MKRALKAKRQIDSSLNSVTMLDGTGGTSLADAIEKLYGDSRPRALLADQGRQDVESYDMRRVARRFMENVSTGTREGGEVVAQ